MNVRAFIFHLFLCGLIVGAVHACVTSAEHVRAMTQAKYGEAP